MNQLITFDEAAGFLRNPPSLALRPDFPKIHALCIHALCKHLTQVLKQLDCPWMGQLSNGPNNVSIDRDVRLHSASQPRQYPNVSPVCRHPEHQDGRLCVGECKEYFLSYINISRTCFSMLDELVPNHFKVLNNPALLRWNPMMSIQTIMAQLEALYGKPTSTILWNNNKLFLADFLLNNAPVLLFNCVKQCQKVVIIADMPYTGVQLISNTMLLLFMSRIFLMRKFQDWEAAQNKTWPLLKTFVHGTYAHKLVASNIRNTTGQLRYAQPAHNMYNMLEMDNSGNNATRITQMAAAANRGSTLSNTYQTTPSTVPQELATAINMLAANQKLLFQHIAPLTQHNIAAEAANASLPTAFSGSANAQFNTWPSLVLHCSQVMEAGTYRGITKVGAAGAMADAEITVAITATVKAAPNLLTTLLHKVGVLTVAKVPTNRQVVSTLPLLTWWNNMITGMSVIHAGSMWRVDTRWWPAQWNGANVQTYLARGCNTCTKEMHNMIFPGAEQNFWHGGAENEIIAYKFNNLVTAHLTSLDPTENLFAAVNVDNNITIRTSNCLQGTTPYGPPASPTIHSMASMARSIFGQPLQEYLNWITIATHQAIADTGATSIFIMDGVNVVNKCLATKALTINMPDGQKVTSTHVCNITIPGLPLTLMWHIVPHLAVATLVGICPLCNAGCTVVFDKNKCNVIYDVNVI
jgi:hypothetical protein